ncbi:MAG: PhoH family protein [Betaproteobacteria bacterium]|nr:PhoH family protein [Betaproteobacteria bacterium]
MKILEYSGLDVAPVRRQYERVIAQIERGDFRSAEVKKLAEHDLYRAKLDNANRLLFKIVRHRGERYALILEAILNHAYDKSRFLRGARIDEAKILPAEAERIDDAALAELPYLNPDSRRFHFLDKIISFDSAQQSVYELPLPLIVIGPAGSGKTALTLEKLKQAAGRVLYVTLSPYLAEHSRNLYYAHRYENPEQEVEFLSLREYLETWRVPAGREIAFGAFAAWLARFPKAQRPGDAHKLFEEFRGVITGSPLDRPWLGREDYLRLGVRQSIFLEQEREKAYALFEKYLVFLKDSGCYDPNIIAHDYLSLVEPAYDFVVVDEVQDVTNVQLQLLLKSLKTPGHFLLCGDSNQIVHPNFFSWAGLKTMFHRAGGVEAREITRVLDANYRSAARVTEVANRLLRVKQRRFGSVDRESNYLMRSVAAEAGEVELIAESETALQELNRRTRRSTRFAVLVTRDEQKTEARARFDTPLLFSIHEAKGLEYDNIILWGFVSGDRAAFAEIARGIAPDHREGDLEYARARDKSDKSLEVYKFFVNALYVALTRAVRRIVLVEADTGHPLLKLLGLAQARAEVEVAGDQSSIEEWQAEAHRLELQGKLAQAEEIRRSILQAKPVPWEVWDAVRLPELMTRALDAKEVSRKPKEALLDYALFYDEPGLVEQLEAGRFERARALVEMRLGETVLLNRQFYANQRAAVLRKHLAAYESRQAKDLLRACDGYGVDHRNTFNRTPLMLAAQAGNAALTDALLARGADPELSDNYGQSAWQIALGRAFDDEAYAARAFPAIHDRLHPGSVSVRSGERLVKLDSHLGEFLLFQAFFVLLRHKIGHDPVWGGFATADFVDRLARLPEAIVPAYRKKRAYLSGVLARNEVESANPYSRRLFRRTGHGRYLLSPGLALRRGEEWSDVYEAAGLPLLARTGGRRGALLLKMLETLRVAPEDRAVAQDAPELAGILPRPERPASLEGDKAVRRRQARK